MTDRRVTTSAEMQSFERKVLAVPGAPERVAAMEEAMRESVPRLPTTPSCPQCGRGVIGYTIDDPPPWRAGEMSFEPIKAKFEPCGHDVPADFQWTGPTWPTND